jgi:cation diffusion facilitator family transporter
MASGDGGVRATIAALAANFGIAVAKFVAFSVTGSASMLAESIHSVADTSNQALLLLGRRRAKRPASPEHPFGYGRERYFWAFVVAVVLFTGGSLLSLIEGFEKFRHPHEIESFRWAVGVLAVAIVFEVFSLAVAVQEARVAKGDSGWWAYIRRAKSPELPVLLLEDLGALLGLVFALTGVSLAVATGEARFDAIGSLAIGVLLGIIAIVLAAEMKSLLIGESATPEDIDAIGRAVAADPDLRELIHMRTQHIGPEELLVGIKVGLRAGLDLESVTEVINRIEGRIRTAVPAARIVYVEPDIARPQP